MRPRASQTWLDARAAARAMRVSVPTATRWLAAWLALGVAGVERVPSRGRYGYALRCTRAVVRRWARCALPSPQPSLRAA